VIEATGILQSERPDVWALIAEPYHLPDWWPAYTGVEPDRRGLAENARWQVIRSISPGFLRKPEGEGVILPAYPFAAVEGPLQVVDSLPDCFHIRQGEIPAGD
jgi:hypothetical protein